MNKHARFNLCFAEEEQEADFANGKGTIVGYKDVPTLQYVRSQLPKYFGAKCEDLACEGNFYYDASKCGIGYHGDGERRLVIGARCGASIPLHFNWF